MKRSIFVDAIIFATLTGLCLSMFVGCASTTPQGLLDAMAPENRAAIPALPPREIFPPKSF